MSSHPLSIIFDCDGSRSLITDPLQLNYLVTTEEGVAFCRDFGHYPPAFLKIENRLRTRCEGNGVTYVPPKITDSVDATFERIKKLNRAIKSAKQKLRRNAMPEKDRKELSAKRSAARIEKLSRESEGDKKQRLKREADWKQKQSDRQFEAKCNKFKVPCPPPRTDDDTAATIRAKRKISRDSNRFAFAKKRAPPSGTIFPFHRDREDDPKRYEEKLFRGPYKSYQRCTWRSTLPGKTNGKRCAYYARQGGYCDAHGGFGRRTCGHNDCNNIAQKGGMCRRHGANLKKCGHEWGCVYYATKGGFCRVHSRPKCSQEGREHYALKAFGGVCSKHYEEPERETFEDHLMQLDEARGGNRMVDAVPQGGECRGVGSVSSVDAVANRGWRDDNRAADPMYRERRQNAQQNYTLMHC
jgi:hypothetical protein